MYVQVTDTKLKARNIDGQKKDWVVHRVESLSPIALNLLDRIVWFATQMPHRPVFLGYEDLAKDFGCHRNSIYNNVKTLVKEGYISIQHHSYNGNQYRINKIFYDLTIRRWLKHLIPSLKLAAVLFSLSLSLLVSCQRNTQTETCDANTRLDIYIPFRTVERLSIVNRECPQWVRDCRIRYSKIKNGYTKEERRMMRDEAYHYAKNEMKNIKLTEWGCHNMASFPLAALVYANDRLGAVRCVVKDRYAMAKSFCLEWCRKNNITPNFQRVDELRARMPEVAELEYYTRSETDGILTKDDESQPQHHSKPHPNSIYAAYSAPVVEVDKNESVQGAVEIIKAQGAEMNPYMRILAKVDRVDKVGVTSSPAPLAPAVIKKPVPTDFEHEDAVLITEVMNDYHKLPETDSSMMMLAKIGGILADGPERPEVKDGSFRADLQHIRQVLEKIPRPEKVANSK